MQSIPLTVTAIKQIHRADFHVISLCVLFIYLLILSHGHPLIIIFRYHLYGVFTTIYLKQPKSVAYIVLQLLCTYSLCYI
jgi:hypothetical protein